MKSTVTKELLVKYPTEAACRSHLESEGYAHQGGQVWTRGKQRAFICPVQNTVVSAIKFGEAYTLHKTVTHYIISYEASRFDWTKRVEFG